MQTFLDKEYIHKLGEYFSTTPIEKAWLFGSYARGEAKKDSDIDLLVKFNQNKEVGLMLYFKILSQIENITGKNIDLVEEGELKDYAKASAKKDKILIYERKTKR